MKKNNKLKLLATVLLIPSIGFCQESKADAPTYFSNALFLTLLITIIILAIVIVAFSSVFKNIADSDYLPKKYANNEGNKSNITASVLVIAFLLSSFGVVAQTSEVAAMIVKDDGLIGGLEPFTFYFMLFVIAAELIILGVMLYQFNYLIKSQSDVGSVSTKATESKLLKSLTGSVAIEDEDTIALDHEYDGIRELDNDLPPWWKYGFYATIIYAVIYLAYYHVLGGDSQKTEFKIAVAKAQAEVDEFMKNSANNVDENTIKLLSDAGDMATGKDVFKTNCAACHGQLGEGGVGPNLTDQYWMHGGSIQDVFKSIKYGWVEKGMKSWKEDLSPMQMAQVASYILSLKGTNPPNAKAAQGDLYSEGADSAKPASDTTTVKVDTLTTTK